MKQAAFSRGAGRGRRYNEAMRHAYTGISAARFEGWHFLEALLVSPAMNTFV